MKRVLYRFLLLNVRKTGESVQRSSQNDIANEEVEIVPISLCVFAFSVKIRRHTACTCIYKYYVH
jgi:hypothetical protein